MTSDKRWHYSLLGLGGDTDGILVTAEDRGWLGPRPRNQGVPSRPISFHTRGIGRAAWLPPAFHRGARTHFVEEARLF